MHRRYSTGIALLATATTISALSACGSSPGLVQSPVLSSYCANNNPDLNAPGIVPYDLTVVLSVQSGSSGPVHVSQLTLRMYNAKLNPVTVTERVNAVVPGTAAPVAGQSVTLNLPAVPGMADDCQLAGWH